MYIYIFPTSFRMMKLNQPFQCHLLYIVTAYRFTKKKGCQTKTTQNSDWPDVAGPPSFRQSCFGRGGNVNPNFGAQAERLQMKGLAGTCRDET